MSSDLIEAIDIERGIRIAIWNGARWQGSPQEVAQSLIRYVMADAPMVKALAEIERLTARKVVKRERLIRLIREQLMSLDYPVSQFECEFADAIIALLETKAVEGEGWRDIASAPKDGRNILVIGLPPLWKGYPFVVFWDSSHERGEGWWRHTDPSLDAMYAVSDSITHWRSLPSPP